MVGVGGTWLKQRNNLKVLQVVNSGCHAIAVSRLEEGKESVFLPVDRAVLLWRCISWFV